MTLATMTSKGQITIPKDVRDELGLEPGTRLDFIRIGPKEYRLRAKNMSLLALGGTLRSDAPAMTAKEMDRAIADSVAEADR